MFLIERANPVRSTPWVVYSLVLVNTLIWILTWWADSRSDIAQRYGFIPAQHGAFSVFSSMFLHFGFWHIAGNMYFLWMFGDNVEDVVGSVWFLPSYLVCGVAGVLLHYMFDPDSIIPCVGASAAISGALGMYLVFFPTVRVDLTFSPASFLVDLITPRALASRGETIKARASVAISAWLGVQTLLGLFTWAGEKKYVGVAFWAHVGGLLAGIALGLVYSRLGFLSRYFESIGGKIDEYMACPVCGQTGRQLPKGRYRCKNCHSRITIDGQGEVHLVWSSESAEQVNAQKLKGTLIAAVMALAAVIYVFLQWKR